MHRLLLSFGLGLLTYFDGLAQAPAQRPLSHADFESWRSLSARPLLSRDGQWLAYTYMPLEGDGDLLIRNLLTQRDYKVPVGALPPPPLTASEENPERTGPRRHPTVVVTSDQRYVVATTFPEQSATRAAKLAKKSDDDAPKEGLVIVSLASGDVERIEGVKSIQIPLRGGPLLAYLREPTSEQKKNKTGSDLVLRDLTGSKPDRIYPDVTDYYVPYDGKAVVFVVQSPDEAKNGVYTVSPTSDQPPRRLLTGKGRYIKFTWDREQSQAVFSSNRNNPAATPSEFSLYHWIRSQDSVAEILTSKSPGFPTGSHLSSEIAATFSLDGKSVLVPTAPIPTLPPEALKSQREEDKVTLDIWHWRDDALPSVQKIQANRDRNKSYTGVYDLASRRFIQLSDESLPILAINSSATHALGRDDRSYRRRVDYDGSYHDLYLVDVSTGKRSLVFQELSDKSNQSWSHQGRWATFYHQKNWYSLDANSGEVRNLTDKLPVAFYDEQSDTLEEPAAYGSAGWSRTGDALLVYDRHDLWQLFADGRPAKNLSQGFGRKENLQLRLQVQEVTEPDTPLQGVDSTHPLTFRAEDLRTRATGFYRIHAQAAPERLLWGDKAFRQEARAAQADKILLSASRFDEYPDLHLTDLNYTHPVRVTNGGAQLEPYLWGSAELISYRNTDGVELQATLYKPANFDPNKKYPMIVYFYERLSQLVHRFFEPLPGTTVSPSFYTSNGYLVLLPDIIYTRGYPGRSAMNCIVPATDAVVQRGFVDERAIGLQGHSWGGYQIAYLVTQTSRYRAAAAGAVVSNMTSAYSGIRWGSGRARQFQYEKTQSRIGPSLQEAPQRYIENSPVFFAHEVKTPLLLLHNDHDDAVPWEQGIEFFLALRRHGKEAYLLNYNDEFHGLRRRASQKDYGRRMQQFFDHFLKGAPRPEWMEKGVRFLDRATEQLRFNAPSSVNQTAQGGNRL